MVATSTALSNESPYDTSALVKGGGGGMKTNEICLKFTLRFEKNSLKYRLFSRINREIQTFFEPEWSPSFYLSPFKADPEFDLPPPVLDEDRTKRPNRPPGWGGGGFNMYFPENRIVSKKKKKNPLCWSDGMQYCRSEAWALFVLLLSTLVCFQPTELIFECYKIVQFTPTPPVCLLVFLFVWSFRLFNSWWVYANILHRNFLRFILLDIILRHPTAYSSFSSSLSSPIDI